MSLFTAEELTRQLQYPESDAISEEDASHTEQVVDGWLSDATELDEWPLPLPKQIKAWAIELGGIAFENPTSMENDSAGDVSSKWRDRREQILRAAHAWGVRRRRDAQQQAATPRGCFPPADDFANPRRW